MTVLIPVLNGMPYLREALASLEKQTFRDFEVLLWDNGSIDETLEEARSWIPSRLPGRIVSNVPMPLHLCLARMVNECHTEFCARMDADDICLPQRFELQSAYLKGHPETVAVGGQLDLIDIKGNFIAHGDVLPRSFAAILSSMLYRNPLIHGAMMFRRNAVLKAGNYREPQPVEDLDLWLRLAQVGKIINLPDTFLKYRQHSGTITDTNRRAGELTQKIFDCLSKNGSELFSIPGPTYGKLLKKAHPLAIVPLWNAAQRIAMLSGSTTWQVLCSREFLDSARCLTAKRDVLSKLTYFFIGRDKSKPMISQILEKARFLPGIHDLVSWWLEKHKQARIRKWSAVQQARGSSIEEIDVRAEFLEQCITMGVGIVLEKEVSLAFVRDKEAQSYLSVGDNVFIGRNTVLSIHAPIIIGANALIGAYCYITSCNHAFESREVPIRDQGYTDAPVTIEAGAWVGTHVVILPGITIGEGAIIGAGSVVNSNVPAYEIWGGSPARFIGHRP